MPDWVAIATQLVQAPPIRTSSGTNRPPMRHLVYCGSRLNIPFLKIRSLESFLSSFHHATLIQSVDSLLRPLLDLYDRACSPESFIHSENFPQFAEIHKSMSSSLRSGLMCTSGAAGTDGFWEAVGDFDVTMLPGLCCEFRTGRKNASGEGPDYRRFLPRCRSKGGSEGLQHCSRCRIMVYCSPGE